VVTALTVIAALSLAAWLYLLFAHHGFWCASEKLPPVAATPDLAAWPSVAVIIPARDEAETIAQTLESLIAQDYAGTLSIVVVDDNSEDGTGALARETAQRQGAHDRITVVSGTALPAGWSGKLWAIEQGVRVAGAPDFMLLTDADTVHAPETLRRLIAKAEGERRDLVSLMVQLASVTFWERLLVPAFIFFFQMLYPFPAVNSQRSAIAGAAGACILVRRTALERIGGVAAIRSALIDDCALAGAVKRSGGAIWLGLADRSFSLRRYRSLREFWRMVARTAFTQLRYSSLLLLLTVLGLTLVYLAPPLTLLVGAFAGDWSAALLGAAAWTLMCIAFIPTLALYRLPAELAFALPLIAALYLLMTLDSALQHFLGKGGRWKGRVYP
jgi:hopene-associated glycosyltransferase HpnB